MARIAGVNIPNHKHAEIALTAIYGIGRNTAKQICLDIDAAYKAPGRPGDLFWRENAHKLAMNESGYCTPGPLRPPFRVVPQEIYDHAKQMAKGWKELCAKYPYKKAAAA